jgi:uncharacterized membrane protein YdcZ (DUF606 family)
VKPQEQERKVPLRERLLPWSSIFAVLVGWALTHQIGSNTNFDRCGSTAPWAMGLLGLAGLAVLLVGGLLSHKVWKRGEAETPARRFLGIVGTGICAIFGAALVFQTISSFIIPQCFG